MPDRFTNNPRIDARRRPRPYGQITTRATTQRAALAWCEQINELPEEQPDGRLWHYVLLGETIVKDWKKNARASELLDYARLRRSSIARQEKLL